MIGPYQSKWTSYARLPESTSTFTLGLVGESQLLFENSIISANLLSVCSQFALNFYHIYFNFIFDPQGDTFWINFDLRAHIRIFQTFRICINFYPILKIGLLCLICSQLSWICSKSKKSGFLPFLAWETLSHFMFAKFWPSRTCPSSFQHFESMKVQIQSYKKTP